MSAWIPERVKRVIRPWLPYGLRVFLFNMQRPRRVLRLCVYASFYNGSAVVRNGLRFQLHPRDPLVSKCFYVDGVYCDEEKELLLRAAQSCRSFIDCGANIGLFTIPLAKLTGMPTVAIEPVASNFLLLSENIRLNGLTDRIQALRIALGAAPGEELMYLSDSNRGNHRLGWVGDAAGRSTEKVAVVTMDAILESHPELRSPILVKMDVEGSELKVLSGATGLLERPCIILMEFCPWALREAGSSVRALEEYRMANSLVAYDASDSRNLRRTEHLDVLAAGLPDRSFCTILLTNMNLQETALAGWISP